MKRLLLLCATLALVSACPNPNTAADWPDDPKTLDEATTACAAAKAKLDQLQCQAARPDFVEFCVHEFKQGIPLHPQCLAKIVSCADVEKC